MYKDIMVHGFTIESLKVNILDDSIATIALRDDKDNVISYKKINIKRNELFDWNDDGFLVELIKFKLRVC